MSNLTEASASARRGWLALAPALRSRNFRLFWLAQIVSTTGTFFQSLAELWLVYRLTDSTLWLGAIGLIGLLPVVPIALVAGLIIDRVPRRKLILATQIGLMGQAAVFGLLILSGEIRIWHIAVLQLVLSGLFAIDQPARQAFLTELVSEDDLANAIALNATIFNVARMVGYLASGVLIATVGAGGSMLANAASYAAPIAALLLIRADDRAKDTDPAPIKSALVEGVRTLWARPPLLAVLGILVVVGGLSVTIYILMAGYASDVLHAGPAALGLLMASSAVGAVLSTALVGRLRGGRRGQVLAYASLLVPVLMFGFSLTRTLWAASLVLVLLGMLTLMLLTLTNTLVQVNVPDRVRGRVMSLYSLLNAGAPNVSAALIGGLAELTGLPAAFAIGAGVALTFAAGLYAAMPSVRRLE